MFSVSGFQEAASHSMLKFYLSVYGEDFLNTSLKELKKKDKRYFEELFLRSDPALLLFNDTMKDIVADCMFSLQFWSPKQHMLCLKRRWEASKIRNGEKGDLDEGEEEEQDIEEPLLVTRQCVVYPSHVVHTLSSEDEQEEEEEEEEEEFASLSQEMRENEEMFEREQEREKKILEHESDAKRKYGIDPSGKYYTNPDDIASYEFFCLLREKAKEKKRR